MNKTDAALVLISLISLADMYMNYLQIKINRHENNIHKLEIDLFKDLGKRIYKLEQAKKGKSI